MKRFLGAFLVGTLVFATVLGSAAALEVNGRVLQVGSDTTMTCQPPAGINVQWNVGPSGIVTSVYVNGIDATACNGQRIYVYPLNSAGTVIGMSTADSFANPECTVGAPLTPSPLDIVDGTTTYKVALGWVNPASNNPTAATYPCGIDASLIAGVRVMIGL